MHRDLLLLLLPGGIVNAAKSLATMSLLSSTDKSINRLATRTRYQKSSTNLNMFSSHVRSISRWNFVQDMERICPGGHLLNRRSSRLHGRTRRRFRHSLAAAKRGYVTRSHRKLIAPHQARTPLRVFGSAAACSVCCRAAPEFHLPESITARFVLRRTSILLLPTTTTAAASKNY
jgi:hypothetical protein